MFDKIAWIALVYRQRDHISGIKQTDIMIYPALRADIASRRGIAVIAAQYERDQRSIQIGCGAQGI